jgi:hypothetical protein
VSQGAPRSDVDAQTKGDDHQTQADGEILCGQTREYLQDELNTQWNVEIAWKAHNSVAQRHAVRRARTTVKMVRRFRPVRTSEGLGHTRVWLMLETNESPAFNGQQPLPREQFTGHAVDEVAGHAHERWLLAPVLQPI